MAKPGTFTPTFDLATTPAGTLTTTIVARQISLPPVTYLHLKITVNSYTKGSGVGPWRIGNLRFVADSGLSEQTVKLTASNVDMPNPDASSLRLMIAGGTTYGDIVTTVDSAPLANLGENDIIAGSIIYVHGWYFTEF